MRIHIYRGVNVKDAKTGNIVKSFHISNTTIKIADDYYRDKEAPEINAILTRVAARAQEHLSLAVGKVCDNKPQPDPYNKTQDT